MNVYEKIGLQRVVNASGRMTALGVSTLSDEVANAAIEGGKSYVVITDLYKKAGEIISTYTKAEDSCPTCSASAGIAITIAAIISKGKKSIIERLPWSEGLANEIIIQKGHVVNYGAPMTSMIKLGGGVPVEVGMANQVSYEDIEEAITDKTAALFYVKSHHCVQKGMVSIQDMIEIAHKHNLPLMIDAAAEEDFEKYVAMGADAVVYSGAKALEATTSGFVTGKKEIMENCRKQYVGIGRSMKVGKEQIMGLLAALDRYYHKDHQKEVEKQIEIVNYLNDELNKIHGLKAIMIQDEAGRQIYRSQVKVDENVVGKTAVQIDKELREGNPSIHCRKHLLNQGIISFDPRPLVDGDKELIVEKMKKVVGE